MALAIWIGTCSGKLTCESKSLETLAYCHLLSLELAQWPGLFGQTPEQAHPSGPWCARCLLRSFPALGCYILEQFFKYEYWFIHMLGWRHLALLVYAGNILGVCTTVRSKKLFQVAYPQNFGRGKLQTGAANFIGDTMSFQNPCLIGTTEQETIFR